MARLFCSKDTYSRKTTKCGECGLFRGCPHPKLPSSGGCEQGILVVVGRPGERESRDGVNLVGTARELLREALAAHGLDLERDCALMHVTGCHGKLTGDYKLCRSRIVREVERRKPRLVLLFGPTATRSVIGPHWSKGGTDSEYTTLWRGMTIPLEEFGCWVSPQLDPKMMAAVATEGQKGRNFLDTMRTVMRLDVGVALRKSRKPPVFFDPAKLVRVLDEGGAVEWLGRAMAEMDADDFPLVAFDYETTGLKPYNKGHRIFCVSFCRSLDEAVSFMWTPAVVPHVKRLLENPKYRKIAANAKFEINWSKVVAGIDVRGMWFDTMQATHVLDNRKGICSVKFQSFVRFGMPDYSKGVHKWLEGGAGEDGDDKWIKDGCANAMNRIFDGPRKELLEYCAMDSLVEYRMGVQMMGEIGIDCGGRNT